MGFQDIRQKVTHVLVATVAVGPEGVGGPEVHAVVVGVEGAELEVDAGLAVDVLLVLEPVALVVAGGRHNGRVLVVVHHLLDRLLGEGLAGAVPLHDVADEIRDGLHRHLGRLLGRLGAGGTGDGSSRAAPVDSGLLHDGDDGSPGLEVRRLDGEGRGGRGGGQDRGEDGGDGELHIDGFEKKKIWLKSEDWSKRKGESKEVAEKKKRKEAEVRRKNDAL